jgi:hypothetical protein
MPNKKGEKDNPTKTFYRGKKGTESRAVVDKFEENILLHGKNFNKSLIRLMDMENRRLADLGNSETSTLKQEREDDNNDGKEAVTSAIAEKEAVQEFLKIMVPCCMGKLSENNGETFFMLQSGAVADYEKFHRIYIAALKAGATLVISPNVGFRIPTHLLKPESL